ncbi:unnamed protein product [Staurois parvus]|uniref:Uncharacterized protein n=1 Tax=Staurois parvus TaxID=386267 RepID=A0ABN9BID6_9NEOB|nr:unnamed protein product [Staurois parvus]
MTRDCGHSTGDDQEQGRNDHLETRALPEGPGSVGGPIRCPRSLQT